MAGEEWPVQSISFHLKSNTTDRSDRISLRGNDKEDYELHFRFQDDKCATGGGEVWFVSDNRPGENLMPILREPLDWRNLPCSNVRPRGGLRDSMNKIRICFFLFVVGLICAEMRAQPMSYYPLR